jgi:hypothetical protein
VISIAKPKTKANKKIRLTKIKMNARDKGTEKKCEDNKPQHRQAFDK